MLRRAQLNVTLASTTEQRLVTASRGIRIEAETTIGSCTTKNWDMIVLPGGMPGARHLSENPKLIRLLSHQLLANKWTAGICASPAVVLAQNHLIRDYKATCYPTFMELLSANVTEVIDQPVVIDRNLITSQAPGTAFEFALTLIQILTSKNIRATVGEAALISL